MNFRDFEVGLTEFRCFWWRTEIEDGETRVFEGGSEIGVAEIGVIERGQ